MRRLLPVWMAALIAGAGVASVLGWYLRSPESPPTVVPLTTYDGPELAPSFSPDGNQVAFNWYQDGNWDVHIKLIGAEEPMRLTSSPAVEGCPAWSPDGRFIAFARGLPLEKAEYVMIPAIGGPERRLAETIRVPSYTFTRWPYLAWLPDSSRLVLVIKESARGPLALFLLSLDTGEKLRLTKPPLGSLGDTGNRTRGQISPVPWIYTV